MPSAMLRAGQGLILIVFSLLAIAVVMVASAGMTVGSVPPDQQVGPLSLPMIAIARPGVFAVIAVCLMLLASRLPVQMLPELRGVASPVLWLLPITLLLLLAVHVPGLGREVNGARRWITLGAIGFQPSEIAKWAVPLLLAWYGVRNAKRLNRFTIGFLIPMALVAIICGLIATEDLGTAVLIAAVSVVLMLAAGSTVRYVLPTLPFAAAGFVIAVIANPYRLDRLRAFLDPYQDPQGIGYHVLQSIAAVSGGGLPGRGLGNGIQKFGYLPEDTTDFIFAVICEELGIVGAATVICLYIALVACGFSIVRRAAHPFHQLFGLGIVLTIGLQAVINLLVVTGLAPTKGIALPLLSAGGTGWCLTAFCIGLLVAIERRTCSEGVRLWGVGLEGRQAKGAVVRIHEPPVCNL